MPNPHVLRRALFVAALLGLSGFSSAQAAPFMIVGDDEKLTWDEHGASVLHPTGKDEVLILDLANPEEPKIASKLQLENSVIGPPVNLAISPDGTLALVADSVTVTDQGGTLKQAPTDKLFVLDLRGGQARLAQTLTLGEQPSGLSINAKGDLALVANRLGKSISVLKIADGSVSVASTVPMGESVSTVEFAPDGAHALAVLSPANQIALLDVDGEHVTDTKTRFPTYLFPYNVVVTPDGKLAITADNGNKGAADGNADAVSVIDHIGVADAPEGIAVSPKGDLVAVASVLGSNNPSAWFYHRNGVVTILRIEDKSVAAVKTIEVGSVPEAMGFTPDGAYLLVGNYLDQDVSILRVTGTDVVDTGKRFKLPGHPAAARMSVR